MTVLTPKKRAEIADDIWQWLEAHELTAEVAIYANGLKRTAQGLVLGVASQVTQYADDNSVTVTFEGPLYELINYGAVGDIPSNEWREDFQRIFERHGCFYELGQAWNLTVYPLD